MDCHVHIYMELTICRLLLNSLNHFSAKFLACLWALNTDFPGSLKQSSKTFQSHFSRITKHFVSRIILYNLKLLDLRIIMEYTWQILNGCIISKRRVSSYLIDKTRNMNFIGITSTANEKFHCWCPCGSYVPVISLTWMHHSRLNIKFDDNNMFRLHYKTMTRHM